MITARHPASSNIPAEISPVNAPSVSQCISCAAIEIEVPFAASTAAASAVNGGATTMSQCVESATSGASAAKYARASACVLYIFQFPAITGRRITPLSLPQLCYIPKSATQRAQKNTEGHREIDLILSITYSCTSPCPPCPLC